MTFNKRLETIIPGFLGFANVYAMRVNLSVAIVYMVKDPGMDWHESQQGIILGMFFYGYVLTQLPGGRLAEIIGEPTVLCFSDDRRNAEILNIVAMCLNACLNTCLNEDERVR